ncbi:hypothetical protein [Puniceibacterium confluentis]|uniref:hypothetical protein n=1 Tax=Puniceibacterium confluentis TaxID=1958944 RepID=UPI0011B452E8|nr:hypothetical protein [Puniceibacterium confluentis]
MITSRTIIAAVLAGAIGILAYSLLVWAVFGIPLAGLVFSFGRVLVALLSALLLIPIFARMDPRDAWITALVTLTVLPTLVAKTAFVAAGPWIMEFAVNAVFAVVTILVFRSVLRRP